MMDDMEFARLFEKYMSAKRDGMRETFNRVLPTGEYIFNRFDKAEYVHAGKGTSIYDTSVIMGDVSIGDYTWVGPYTVLEGANAALRIGDFCSIDTGACIYTHDTTKTQVSIKVGRPRVGDVIIGNHTVIGTHAMVSCGVKIGNHCVVGAYSMVKCDIPDFSIAVGIPARIIGKVVFDDEGNAEFRYF